MGKFIVRRLILLIPMILGVSFLVFVFMDLAPGTVLDSVANDLSEAELARLYHEYGYDRSVLYRFWLYLQGMLRGSLGYSYIYKTDVLTLYFSRFPATLSLAFSSLMLAVILSIPLGVLAAANRGKAADGKAIANRHRAIDIRGRHPFGIIRKIGFGGIENSSEIDGCMFR